ncbi:MAG: Na+/H+ antiporter NhaA, partial [Pseudomonadales bacterium]|nr:Na+/H+ antiporter NhaA [Pseudomonadales bacterium]
MHVLSSALLLLATGAALVWANSPWAASYLAFWQLPWSSEFGTFVLSQ